MGKIFCVMGKSASGKDTIYNKILQDDYPVYHSPDKGRRDTG